MMKQTVVIEAFTVALKHIAGKWEWLDNMNIQIVISDIEAINGEEEEEDEAGSVNGAAK